MWTQGAGTGARREELAWGFGWDWIFMGRGKPGTRRAWKLVLHGKPWRQPGRRENRTSWLEGWRIDFTLRMELSCYRQPKIIAFELLLASLKCCEWNFQSAYLPVVTQLGVGCRSGRLSYFQQLRTAELGGSWAPQQALEEQSMASVSSPNPGDWCGSGFPQLDEWLVVTYPDKDSSG